MLFLSIDGSLNLFTFRSADRIRQLPVYAIASGPTNSMRGAAFLSGIQDAVVVDIGGTTTNVGVIKGGFPRQASTRVKVNRVLWSSPVFLHHINLLSRYTARLMQAILGGVVDLTFRGNVVPK